MLALLFFAANALVARVAARRLWRDTPAGEAPGPCERAASVALVAMAIAVAVDWALALAHLFYGGALLAATAALAVAAWKGGALRGLRPPPRLPLLAWVALVPAFAWALYATFRGWVVYPWNNDVLSYHLPKALLVVRAHAYAAFDGPDTRIPTFPADYELLLADFLALDGSDRLTITISVFAFGGLGLVTAAMAERWWGRGAIHTTLAVVLTLGVPAVILGGGAHKNDVLLAALVVAAAHFGARWGATGHRAGLALATLATALAVGTKPNGGVLLPALLPCVLVRARAALRAGGIAWGAVARWVALAAGVGVLLGGAAYLVNLFAFGRPIGALTQNGYGDWPVLWKFPLLVWIRGFCVDDVWVPWKHERWFWPQYDLWYGTWGLLTSIALIAFPFALAANPRDARAGERRLATMALGVAFVVVLPLRYQQPPVGLFETNVRYTLFVPPLVFLWTFVRWAKERSTSDARWLVQLVLLLSAVTAGFYGVHCALDDTWAPIEVVLDMARGRRPRDQFQRWNARAAFVLDGRAGPDDAVAIDGGFDTWVYPAYGSARRRRVTFLHASQAGGPVSVPDDARWVAIDRSWNIVFGAPGFLDFGTYYRDTMHGKPLPEDLAVFHQLEKDPHFRLVYRDAYANQALFERVP